MSELQSSLAFDNCVLACEGFADFRTVENLTLDVQLTQNTLSGTDIFSVHNFSGDLISVNADANVFDSELLFSSPIPRWLSRDLMVWVEGRNLVDIERPSDTPAARPPMSFGPGRIQDRILTVWKQLTRFDVRSQLGPVAFAAAPGEGQKLEVDISAADFKVVSFRGQPIESDSPGADTSLVGPAAYAKAVQNPKTQAWLAKMDESGRD